MQRSSSVGPALQTDNKDKKQAIARIEKDYKQRHNLKKVVTYEQQLQIANRRLYVGNPILRKAIDRDATAVRMERAEKQFAKINWQIMMWERNAMDREDVHSCQDKVFPILPPSVYVSMC